MAIASDFEKVFTVGAGQSAGTGGGGREVEREDQAVRLEFGIGLTHKLAIFCKYELLMSLVGRSWCWIQCVGHTLQVH